MGKNQNSQSFSENQFVAKSWTWRILVIILLGIFIPKIIYYDYPNVITPRIIIFFVFLTAISSSYLKSSFNKHEIRIKYFPYHWSDVVYKKEDIETIKLIRYNSLLEFWGWGIRYNWVKKYGGFVKCFNVSGTKGILLTLKNKKKRLIGTKKSVEIQLFLKENGYEQKICNTV